MLLLLTVVSIFLYKYVVNIKNIIKYHYIYPLSWEDGQVDLKVLNFDKYDVVLGITTGGDNIINYLTRDVKEVHSCDINKYQNYLLETKIAMIKVFTQKEYFSVFNDKTRHPLFLEKLEEIKGHMTKDAGDWLSSNLNIMDNLIYSGTGGKIYKLFYHICNISGFINIVKCNTIEEQIEFVEKYKYFIWALDKLIWNKISMNYFNPLGGVPESQYNLMKNENNYLYNCFNYLCRNFLIKENHFYGLILGVPISNKCCPFYLKKENYDFVKNRLNRITIHKSYIHNVVKDLPNKPTKIILLDHMDWLNNKQIKEEFQIYQKYCPNAEFLWRSASRKQYITCLDRLDYEITYELNYKDCKYGDGDVLKDRVGMYPSTYVATFPQDKKLTFDNIKEVKYKISLVKKFKIFMKMNLHPLLNKFTSNHKDFLNNFYKNQAEDYDAYRQDMLHGKKPLMESIPFCIGDNLLILGCGTADILEHIKVKKLNQVVGVDLCEPLLKIAKERIKTYKWNNVQTYLGDATKYKSKVKYDIIIISYCITMVNNWIDLISIIKSSLKPNGYLCVSDFTELDDIQSKFMKFLFKHDGVILNKNHIEVLNENFGLVDIKYEYGGFPFVPLLKSPYYHGVWKNTKI
jgi:S-adenosylmethionine-diacylgycerolhomoserine-N-methlytransferase